MLNQEVDDTKEPKIFRKKPVEICAMKWTGKNIKELVQLQEQELASLQETSLRTIHITFSFQLFLIGLVFGADGNFILSHQIIQ